MIGVAHKIAETGVHHTIYADNITQWVSEGSDAHTVDKL